MRKYPYSIAVDGSNDQDLAKMYPVSVRIYDAERSSVVTRFLDICAISGTENSTAQGWYSLVEL